MKWTGSVALVSSKFYFKTDTGHIFCFLVGRSIKRNRKKAKMYVLCRLTPCFTQSACYVLLYPYYHTTILVFSTVQVFVVCHHQGCRESREALGGRFHAWSVWNTLHMITYNFIYHPFIESVTSWLFYPRVYYKYLMGPFQEKKKNSGVQESILCSSVGLATIQMCTFFWKSEKFGSCFSAHRLYNH